jgi:hypothetical protein
MSNETKLFRKIVQETEAGELEWKLVPRGRYSELIFQPNQVFRLFQTTFTKDDDDYTVLLVEKKYDDPDWDFELEKYRPEVYFLYDQSIVLVIDEDTVDMNQLIRLVKRVELSTDRAKRLLG